MTRARPALPAVVAAALLAGCTQEFTPPSVLDGLRVLALVAEPPEAGPGAPPAPGAPAPGEDVTVRAFTWPEAGDPTSPQREEAWSFCPITAGATTGYRCLAQACETPLVPAPDGTVTANPYRLALACLAALGGGGELPPGAVVPDQVETVFRYTVRSGGTERTAVARVPLFSAERTAAERNRSPVIARVELGGAVAVPGAIAATAAAGAKVPLAVALDPASIQPYVDTSGREVFESVVVEVFSTAGRFDADRGPAPDATFELELTKLAPDAAEAAVYVVARDLRGGQAVGGPYRIAITR